MESDWRFNLWLHGLWGSGLKFLLQDAAVPQIFYGSVPGNPLAYQIYFLNPLSSNIPFPVGPPNSTAVRAPWGQFVRPD